MSLSAERIRYVDSHTAGEPTRVVIAGGPEIRASSLAQSIHQLRECDDHFRQTVIHEPRGWDALVGAFLCEPTDPSCACGVIFFNNAGYLAMCGHGAIGVVVTLHHLGRIGLGQHRLETPAGIVVVNLRDPHEVAIENVPSYRLHARVDVDVEGLGVVTGDVAWGGNWFFLVDRSPEPLTLANVDRLTEAARRVRSALTRDGITGTDDAEIDHIEFFGPPVASDAHSRNFVLCPGGAYDRSPCGTGTSAKLACLAADGKLRPGELWIQESIIGSRFRCRYRCDESQRFIPEITGQAYVCGEGVLIRQRNDPFRCGIPRGEA